MVCFGKSCLTKYIYNLICELEFISTLNSFGFKICCRCNFFKTFIVLFSQCPHQPVPYREIQDIISVEIVMMHVVRNRCIHPFSKPMPAEVFRIKLKLVTKLLFE